MGSIGLAALCAAVLAPFALMSALPTPDFPRNRAMRTAWMQAEDGLSRWRAAVVTALAFAFIGAFFTLPARSTWGQRFVNGAISAAIAIVIVFGLSVIWHGWRYRQRKSDPQWFVAAFLAGNAAEFILRQADDSIPELFTKFGLMECIVRTPHGEVLTMVDYDRHAVVDPNLHLHGREGKEVFGILDGADPGAYEVRWYGSKKRGRLYEIARACPVLEVGRWWPEELNDVA